MEDDYPLPDRFRWFDELCLAATDFNNRHGKWPYAVGYSNSTYRQICILVNAERGNLQDAHGSLPPKGTFAEIGHVQLLDGHRLMVWTSDEMFDDSFSLIWRPPEDDGGEELDVAEGGNRRWTRAA